MRKRRLLAMAATAVCAVAVVIPAGRAVAVTPVFKRDVTVAVNGDGRLEVFGIDAAGVLQHRWEQPVGGWSGWESLGSPSSGVWDLTPLAVGANRDGRLEVFVVAIDGSVGHIWQGETGGWTGWASLGGNVPPQKLGVGSNDDGRLEIFAVGYNNNVAHNYQVTPEGAWSGWISMGHPPLDPDSTEMVRRQVVVGTNWANFTKRLEIFVLASETLLSFPLVTRWNLWHAWQVAPNSGWSTWTKTPDTVGIESADLLVAANLDNRLEVFMGSPLDGAEGVCATHQWQLSPGGTTWSPDWGCVPGYGVASNIGVGSNADGRLELFGVGPGRALVHNYQFAPNGATGWSGWVSLGGANLSFEAPAVASRGDGRLEVFAVGTDGSVYHTCRVAPNSGWTAVAPLGSGQCQAAPGDGGGGGGGGGGGPVGESLDGDSRADLLALYDNGQLNGYRNNNGIATGGTFGTGVLLGGGWELVGDVPNEDIYFGDIDGDGMTDVITRHANGNAFVQRNNSGIVSGTFGGAIQVGSGWANVTVYLADLDGDHRDDLVWKNSDGTGWVRRNTGGIAGPMQTFTAAPVQVGSGWNSAQEIYFGDLDGDGRDDLVWENSDGTGWVRRNTGGIAGPMQTFTAAPVQVGSGWNGLPNYIADVDGDGRDDLAWQYADGTGWVRRNLGGIAGPGQTFTGPPVQIGAGWQNAMVFFS